MYNAQWLQNTKKGSFKFSCQTIKLIFLLFSNTYFNFHLICGGRKLILTSRFLLQIFYKKVEIGFCFSSSSFIPVYQKWPKRKMVKINVRVASSLSNKVNTNTTATDLFQMLMPNAR